MPPHTFESELWLWREDSASWAFVSLPPDVTDEIDESLVGPPRGFGSVRVEVRIGSTTWQTSLFPSKASATYVLPVKKAVRKAESLEAGDTPMVHLTVLDATA